MSDSEKNIPFYFSYKIMIGALILVAILVLFMLSFPSFISYRKYGYENRATNMAQEIRYGMDYIQETSTAQHYPDEISDWRSLQKILEITPGISIPENASDVFVREFYYKSLENGTLFKMLLVLEFPNESAGKKYMVINPDKVDIYEIMPKGWP